MDDALRTRLDAVLVLLVANFLLLLGIAFESTPETTVGLLALAALLGYGLVRR
jgi:MYXO-CTERM domain-containing protein